ncbi:MAG: cytochrome P450 [Novosphingobium sp.]
MLRSGIADVSTVIPAAILDQRALQLPGPGAPLVISDPALIREVLVDRAGQFARDRFMKRLLRRAWGKGLAGAEGQSWQDQRRAAAPAFRPQAVADNAPAFAAAAAKAAASWPLGQPAELTVQAGGIIADVVFTTLVDGRGEVDTAAVAADMPGYVRRIAAFGNRDLLPLPESWHDHLNGFRRDPAVRRVRALAERLAGKRDASGNDLVALMNGVGPVEDNIRGLFPAAMDTTVAGTSWALYTLACRPHWQDRVAAEARAAGGDFRLEKLPITRRVVQEVLRLYPPAPFLIRSSATAGDLGGLPLNKGQPVAIAIYAMHRHRRIWDNPDSFDPDRFLPERGPHPGWLPFGAGPRVCIAAQFALAEIVAVAARLLMELELAPADPPPQICLKVTTRSTSGLNVTARRRD